MSAVPYMMLAALYFALRYIFDAFFKLLKDVATESQFIKPIGQGLFGRSPTINQPKKNPNFVYFYLCLYFGQ